MHFELREGLRVCVVAGSAIFLDISSGRYFGIHGEQLPAFVRWHGDEDLSARDLVSLEELRKAGILIAAAADAVRPQPSVQDLAAPGSLIDTSRARPGPGAIFCALACRLIWSWRVKHWRFERLIAKLSRADCPIDRALSPVAAARLSATVRAFEIVGVVFGQHDRCLGLSLALTAACRKQGVPAQLVVAVQAAPFAAHSWVQHGATTLNEKPDIAQLFTPILVV